MKWITLLCVSIASLSVFCPKVNPTGLSLDDKKEESGPPIKFIPTSEWQKVEKGQPLPAGLHYRLNINTGETEAKLLDSRDPEASERLTTGLVAVPSEKEDGDGVRMYMSKDELKKVLADIPADDVNQESGDSDDEPNGKEKYRSYEELKEEFGTLNVSVKTDMEILNELVEKAKQFSHSNDGEEEYVRTLKDLEYLVHQIDNAREFIRLGGLTRIVIPSLNATSPQVRAESLWLLGSASQNNPKVQIAVLNAGIMSKLVKAIVLDPDASVHACAIFALSCLTRQFPAAQAKLVEEGGLESLKGIFDSKRTYDFKTKMRVITLINDILLERSLVRRAVDEYEHTNFSEENEAVEKLQLHKRRELEEKLRQYNTINLEKRLVEDGWCFRLSDFLWKLHESGMNSGRTQRRDDLGSVISQNLPYRPEHDAVEKVIGTLLVMKDICLQEFQSDPKLDNALRNFFSWYQDLSIREQVHQKRPSKLECSDSKECHHENDSDSVEDDNELYYTGIADTMKELLKFLGKPNLNKSNKKDEL